MSKTSGLGDDLLVGGYHIGSDTQQLSLHGGPALIDVTDITQSAHSRLGGLRDGGMEMTVYHDPAPGMAHDALKGLPTADTIATYLRSPVLGAPAACCNGKQIGYDPTRSNSGELTIKTQIDSDGYGLEWGVQLTPGVRTDTAATNGPAVDGAGGLVTPAVPASGTPVTNSSPLPVQVVVTGGTVTNVAVNGATAGTGDGTYTLPAAGSITLTYSAAPTWTWTAQTGFGAQAYLQAAALTGTSATVTVQHSPDGSSWSTLLAFTAVTAAPTAQRLDTANTTTVGRYVRAITTGTFTSFAFAVVFVRNPIAGVTF